MDDAAKNAAKEGAYRLIERVKSGALEHHLAEIRRKCDERKRVKEEATAIRQ